MYPGDVWIETTMAEDYDTAYHYMERNDTYLVVIEHKEFKKIDGIIREEDHNKMYKL